MRGAQAGASSCCSGAPAWSHLGGRSRAPPFRPLCLSVSLQEGGPAARTPPPPRPVSTALSLARCRLLGSGWGAAADAVTSRGVSPGLLPSSALAHAPNSSLLAFPRTASDHSLVPWGGALDLHPAGCSVEEFPLGRHSAAGSPALKMLPASCLGACTAALRLNGGHSASGPSRDKAHSQASEQHLVAWATVTSASAALSRIGPWHSRHPGVPVRDPSSQ